MAAETTDTSHQDLPQSPQQTAAAPHSRGRGLLAGRGEWLFVIVALAATTVIRFILAFRGWPFVNSDEATLGLMVDDILWHGAHPAFTYGLHHLGAIDAYLQAPFFLLLGPTDLTIRIVTTFQILFFLVIFYLFTRKVFSVPVALVTLFLLALGGEQALLFQLRANRHGQDTLVFSALLLWLVYLRLCRPNTRRYLFLLDLAIGLVAGLALWNTLLTLPFALGAALALAVEAIKILRRRVAGISGQWLVRQALVLVAGFLVGFSPYLVDFVKTKGGIVKEGFSTAGVGGGHGIEAIIQQVGVTFTYALPSLFGSTTVCAQCQPWPLTDPASSASQVFMMTVIGLAISGLFLGCWLFVVIPLIGDTWSYIRSYRQQTGSFRGEQSNNPTERAEQVEQNARWWGRAMLAIGTGITVLQYASSRASFTGPGTNTRYLVGIYLAVPFVAVALSASVQVLWRWLTGRQQRRVISWRALLLSFCGVILLLALFAVNTVGVANALQDATNTQQYGVPASTRDTQLLNFLAAHHSTRFYTTWLVCYHLMFASREQDYCYVVSNSDAFTPGTNLVPSYQQQVTSTAHPAYVFDTTTSEVNPSVPQDIAHLIATGDPRFTGYTTALVGGYIVFYYAGP